MKTQISKILIVAVTSILMTACGAQDVPDTGKTSSNALNPDIPFNNPPAGSPVTPGQPPLPGQPPTQPGIPPYEISSQQNFINQLYPSILKRQADQAGSTWWLNEVQSGRIGCYYLVASFLQTESAGNARVAALASANLNVKVSYMKTYLYAGVLGRAYSQSADGDFWQAQMAAGMNLATVEQHFLNSSEFRGRCSNAGIAF